MRTMTQANHEQAVNAKLMAVAYDMRRNIVQRVLANKRTWEQSGALCMPINGQHV